MLVICTYLNVCIFKLNPMYKKINFEFRVYLIIFFNASYPSFFFIFLLNVIKLLPTYILFK